MLSRLVIAWPRRDPRSPNRMAYFRDRHQRRGHL